MRNKGTRREEQYSYTRNGNNLVTTIKQTDGTIITQTTTNGFGQYVVQAQPNTLGGFICTRSEYNTRGLLVKSFRDTGLGTEVTAPTHYEYDAMGNVVRQALALAAAPAVSNSPVTETGYSAEYLQDGVYSITTTATMPPASRSSVCRNGSSRSFHPRWSRNLFLLANAA